MIVNRTATPADAPTIAEFQIPMALESEGVRLDPETVRKGVAAVFADPSKGRYYLCERDGKVVGCLLIAPEWSDWRNGTVWWIHSVYLEPSSRGQGLFSGLYRHIRALAEKDPSIRGLRLYVDRGNRHAQDVYARIGMKDEHYALFEWMKP